MKHEYIVKDDWELVAMARQGDIDAFTAIVERHQAGVIRFCRRMLGSVEDAEDVAQETFIRVYKHLNRITARARFTTVLFGIARNLTLNTLRDEQRRGRNRKVSLYLVDESSRTTMYDIADTKNNPDKSARNKEMDSIISRALDSLSPEHREVLILREMQGMDYKEIAHVVHTRQGTVKSRLARAREQLRNQVMQLAGEIL